MPASHTSGKSIKSMWQPSKIATALKQKASKVISAITPKKKIRLLLGIHYPCHQPNPSHHTQNKAVTKIATVSQQLSISTVMKRLRIQRRILMSNSVK